MAIYNSNTNEQMIWRFANKLRGVVPFYGFSSNAIKLVFMKYMSEFDDVYDQEDFKTLMKYKNMFILKEFNPSIVSETFKIVERIYDIENGLLSRGVEDLFKLFEGKADYIFDILNEVKLSKDSDAMIDFVEKLLDYGENKDVSRTGVSTTNASLVKLVDAILDVKSNETYMDCFAGFCKSALRMNAANYLGYELNPEVATVANMIMILTGKKRFSIKNQDFYLQGANNTADKVFSDGPLGVVLKSDEYSLLSEESRKCEWHSIKSAVEALKQGGMAVVTASSSVLLKRDFRELRERLTLRNVKAVIALPALWEYTSLPTNIIVFEKDRVGNDVMMIDASGSDCFTRPDKRTVALKDEAIDKILRALNGEVIENFSEKVDTEMILKANMEQSWAPVHYIKKYTEEEYRPSEEVSKELNKAYEDLFELLKKEN